MDEENKTRLPSPYDQFLLGPTQTNLVKVLQGLQNIYLLFEISLALAKISGDGETSVPNRNMHQEQISDHNLGQTRVESVDTLT